MLLRKLFMTRHKSHPMGSRLERGDSMNDMLPKSESTAEGRSSELPFIAYRVNDGGPTLDVAPADRKWMNETTSGFANRCLPLRIANQAGWFLRSHETIEVIWDGRLSVNGLTIVRGSMDGVHLSSHFGHGILTWTNPYLFRTPPGYNLYVRGPANWCKDGACPLDAIVETDWTEATFTMNWKITRVGQPIRFEKGEPICMIFPVARGEMERFRPELRRMSDDKELQARHKEWAASRSAFIRERRHNGPNQPWQKHYYIGKSITGSSFGDHQVRLKIHKFKLVD